MVLINTGISLRGSTMHFSEIIKLQLLRKNAIHCLPYIAILKVFTHIIHQLSLKNEWLPPIQ